MPHNIKGTVQRVKKGDGLSRPISTWGFSWDEAPADGFVICTNYQGQVPIFVSDRDLAEAKKKGVSELRGWGDEDHPVLDEAVG